MNRCAPDFSQAFLGEIIEYLDCTGRTFGALGFLNIGGSSILNNLLLLGLTAAIAFFGVRLIVGERLQLSDGFSLTLRIGLVLTLALSWSAVRPLIHDTFFDGPTELASVAMGASSSLDSDNILVSRLEQMDRQTEDLTALGTGRSQLAATQTADGEAAAASFSGQALSDDIGFAAGRYALLATYVAGLGALKFLGGILLMLLPIISVFLLFGGTQHLAGYWFKGLLAIGLAHFAIVLLGFGHAGVLTPWLDRALSLRDANVAIPAAPLELLLINSVFLATSVLLLVFILRLAGASGRLHTILKIPPSEVAIARAGSSAQLERMSRHSREERLAVAAAADRRSIAAPRGTWSRRQSTDSVDPATAADRRVGREDNGAPRRRIIRERNE